MKKVYFIIYLLIFLSGVFVSSLFSIKEAVAINTMNEGYSLGGTGSAVYINYPSASGLAGKRVYRNSGTSSVYVPTKTDAEVTAFCAVASNVGAVCNDCGWGSWYNTVCQSNSVWQTKIDSSYCGSSYSTGAACWYCTNPAGTHIGDYDASNRAACSNHGTYYNRYRCSGPPGNYVYHELSYCSCDSGWWGGSCENACTYNGWSNIDCQSNSLWYATRTVASGAGWGSCNATQTWNNGSCGYCSTGSTCGTYSAYSACVVWVDSGNCNALPGCPSGYSCAGNGGCYSCAWLRGSCRAYCTATCLSNHTCP